MWVVTQYGYQNWLRDRYGFDEVVSQRVQLYVSRVESSEPRDLEWGRVFVSMGQAELARSGVVAKSTTAFLLIADFHVVPPRNDKSD